MKNLGLNQYDEGGTHNENPIGGIPQGIGSNGKLNMVEEGETSFNVKDNKYIFSNKLHTNKEMKLNISEQFNLPSYVKGKTFAEASKAINNKFKGRNDTASLNTKNELLTRLSEAQEYIKLQQSMKTNSTEIDPAMNQAPEQINEMSLGGILGGATDMIGNISGNNSSGEMGKDALGGALSGAAAGASLGPIGAAAGLALGGITSIIGSNNAKNKQLAQDKTDAQNISNSANLFSLGGNIDPTYPQDPNKLIKSFKTNKEALDYSNPYPNRSDRWNIFNTYQSNLKRRGSFDSSGDISNNRVLRNDGENSTVTFNGESLTSKEINKIRNSRPIKKDNNNAVINKALNSNSFERGGVLGNLKDSLNGMKTPSLDFSTKLANTNITPHKSDSFLDKIGNKISNTFKDSKDFLNKSSTKKTIRNIGRAAPIITNAIQASNLKKPNFESLNRLDNRYQKQYVDEAQLQNLATNQFNSNSEALANASGGNTASLRANILANSLNRNKALSNSYLQANNINRAENQKAQQFNLGVDTTNLQQSNAENDINARNLGAYNTQKSKLLSSVGEDIGAVAKEKSQMEAIAKMYGYTWDGQYIKDKEGNIIDPKTLTKKKPSMDFTKALNKNKGTSDEIPSNFVDYAKTFKYTR